jgi:phage-related protein
VADDPKRLPVAFWRSATGAEPVREWLRALGQGDRYDIGAAIKTVEFGWPIGMPVCRPMAGGLWEVRVSLDRGRIARVLFCIYESQMILLHGFMKKTQKTPIHDIALARGRKRQLEGGGAG